MVEPVSLGRGPKQTPYIQSSCTKFYTVIDISRINMSGLSFLLGKLGKCQQTNGQGWKHNLLVNKVIWWTWYVVEQSWKDFTFSVTLLKNLLLVLESLTARLQRHMWHVSASHDRDAWASGSVLKSTVRTRRRERESEREKRSRINFLWEECGCYPSQLESAGSHTRGMVNI